jgi:hypothetical protein
MTETVTSVVGNGPVISGGFQPAAACSTASSDEGVSRVFAW